jgi:hypothetical protein
MFDKPARRGVLPIFIAVVDAETERARLRAELDHFEERYQLPSDRLQEAFTGGDGSIDENEDFQAWDGAWASYQILSAAAE